MQADGELRYPAIRAYLANMPWAILPEKLEEIEAFLAFAFAGGRYSAAEVVQRIGAAAPRAGQSTVTPGGVAVIPLYGTITMRAGLMSQFSGGTSTEQLGASLRDAMSDPDVAAVVFDVDSPGGTVDGVPELADQISAYRGQKPMVAVANTLCASAAYWLMSQCNEVVVTPSGQVGAIGVVTMHQDVSGMHQMMGVKTSLISAGKFKTENNPYEPMTDEGRGAIQQSVDDFYGMFTAHVARGRGVQPGDVRDGMGQGRVVNARRAVSLGLADRVATLGDTVSRLSSGQGRARVKAELEEPGLTAVDIGALETIEHEIWLMRSQ